MTANDNDVESLASLSEAEQRVLAKLVRLFVRSDGELTGPERAQIGGIADEAGADGFWKLMDEAAQSTDTAEDIMTAAKAVGSKGVQERIYGALYELSIADTIDAGENAVLDQLAALWSLEVKDVPS